MILRLLLLALVLGGCDDATPSNNPAADAPLPEGVTADTQRLPGERQSVSSPSNAF